MPIWPLLYAAQNTRKLLTTVSGMLREHWRTLIMGPLLVTAMIFLSLPLIVVLFPIMPIYLIAESIHWIRDWIQWRRCTRGHGASITGQEFLELVGQYHHRRFRNLFTRFVREQCLLIAVEDTETLVNRLALAVEQAMLMIRKEAVEKMQAKWWSIRSMKSAIAAIKYIVTASLKIRPKKVDYLLPKRVGSTLSASDFFDLWYAEYIGEDKQLLAGLGPEFLDEICMLLEQVRASRRDRE